MSRQSIPRDRAYLNLLDGISVKWCIVRYRAGANKVTSGRLQVGDAYVCVRIVRHCGGTASAGMRGSIISVADRAPLPCRVILRCQIFPKRVVDRTHPDHGELLKNCHRYNRAVRFAE